jgi:hypothetical protein
VTPAFQDGFETVEAVILLGPLLPVATHAMLFKERSNILLIRNALFVRNGRKFADIIFVDVPFLGRRILGGGRPCGQQKAEGG